MDDERDPLPACLCGCGGRVAGPVRRYLNGHNNMRGGDPLNRVAVDPETDCRLWRGWTNPSGYGMLRLGGKAVGARRVAFERAHGPVPPGHDVLPRCGRVSCIAADHLEAVPRASAVERRSTTKLGPEEMREIRAEVSAGTGTEEEIAAAHGITRGHVNNVKRRHSWKHVE